MNALRFYVTVILLGFSVEAHQFNSTSDSNDFMALKAFMNGIEAAINGWTSNSSNFCDWDGISCDFSGKVIGLQLSKKKLVGTLDDSLANLDHLKTLNMSGNLLKGTLPISVFHLSHLEILDLSSNEFSGSLPASVNLPSIQILDISDNNLVGPISPGLCMNSTRIRILKLGVNYFDGEIPQEFGNCSSLEQLYLNANYVSGITPEFLFRLPSLCQLSLQDNNLIGQLHNSNPSNLVYLDVSINGLSGNLPDIFATFPNLSYFAAHSNNLFGRIPPSLSNSHSISFLSLRNNSLVGSIDLNCSAMINLKLLDLVDNKFQGSMPDNLPSCQRLETIDLGGNNLTGQIPESFKRFDSLSYLSLTTCHLENLSASLEIIQHCPNLTTLVLSRSFNNEKMPSNANLQFKMLKTLVIANCKLTGTIPLWLKGLTKLRILDLSLNQLTGQIPPFIGDFSSLIYLDLSNNFLSGWIPKNLTWLPGLRFHNISLRVSVDLPFIRKKGRTRKVVPYSYGIQHLPTLDLSYNSLTGPIWPEFGSLINIGILNLKYNKLSGNIPSSFGDLLNLVNLDLSHNNLSGHIPLCLVRLSFLSKFSVAYNNLTGIIPSGGQFSTFSSSSFEGNPGLCGKFVLKCRKFKNLLKSPTQEKNEVFYIISLPEWSGFATGFLVTIIVLCVLPTIRDIETEEI